MPILEFSPTHRDNIEPSTNNLPPWLIGSYNPIAPTELGMTQDQINTFENALNGVRKFEQRANTAIKWYQTTIQDYHQRIIEKRLYIKALHHNQFEYQQLLSLAFKRKWKIQGGNYANRP